MILKSEDFVGSTHHEKIILSRRDIEVGHFILTLLRPGGGAEMAVTWEP